ncbi:hypothetical protein CPAST_c11750 [Clostridium pasteurianum DSM 525 = ATCC 6013]|uniref:Uncharacterized protein n=1 Tax=Clostridium pasteurianum DSM 525 = ATCC 6013 TaxID=1262449 RepID=A0A0H3J8A5_CLOPA|nr:hypothetical protein [Clostridium pasteurianum]AJA47275.1 hypothetical protein CPAST_c11750 [Clostridium pasteurianum DSM 525 = ATCC 6013]AJA51263.1 hypothetical protein CLPA_c11750 [Clostridium pasteurianum DSM 525 = ATCC 6013]AOZ74617.1 hypothetical protein AQ983_05675 [Clostridium pasteurianum DSM 525 = ATCC 6013]AOZ78414.1 hypothetical protein AQ984_05665 [Clostridium pasteurianum]ELP57526.1 hypothetical protein F502_19276 [Clostridium pasteurianum DSM 525 = ATCC 6013]
MIDRIIKQYYYDLYKKFYLNAGIMSCFVKSLPFVSAINMQNLNLEIKQKSSSLKLELIKEDLIIMDISAEKGLNYAYKYRGEYTIIPDFNMVCHDFGIVKSKPILEKLTLFKDVNLKVADKYMIVLDYNRYKNVEIKNINEYNNQYEVTEEDLPEVEMIKFLDIKTVSYICPHKIKEDIAAYLNYLKFNNINVDIKYVDSITKS